MNKLKKLIFLLLILTAQGCSTQNKIERQNFKNTIEHSIEATSAKINPLIKEINTALKAGQTEKNLMKMYLESKSSVQLNKELIYSLADIDTEFNLKGKTVIYLEDCDEMLDSLILPAIKYFNKSEPLDKSKIIEFIDRIQKMIQQTSSLSDSIDEFCSKYDLPRQMTSFEKKELEQKIQEVKRKIRNKTSANSGFSQ